MREYINVYQETYNNIYNVTTEDLEIMIKTVSILL